MYAGCFVNKKHSRGEFSAVFVNQFGMEFLNSFGVQW